MGQGRGQRLVAALWFWLLLTPLARPQSSELGEAFFETVGDTESIPNNVVSALAQDLAGFLWIGTSDGLVRYDGYRFVYHGHDPGDPTSLSGDFVRCLLAAQDGRIWVGTNVDGVSIFDPRKGQFTRLRHDPARADSLSNDTVRALAEDADGGIWIGTRDGLDQVAANGTLIRHRHRLGASSIDNDEYIAALLVDSKGGLWVGSWNGLSHRAPGASQFERVHASPDAALAGEQIAALLELDDGRIAIGTSRRGSFLLDPVSGLLQPLDGAGTDSSQPAVLALLEPRPGQLWLGVFGGIDVVATADPKVVRRLRPDPAVPSSLAHDQVRAFLKDQSGQIWIGGYGGGLQRHDPGNEAIRMLRHSPSRPGTLSLPSVSSVLERDNGELWIGTRGNGIDILTRDRGVVRGLRPGADGGGLRSGAITALAQTAPARIWAGSLDGLHRIDPDSGAIDYYGVEQGLPNTYVRRLLAGRGEDELWIGTDAGLVRLRGGQMQTLADAAGQPLREDVNALVLAADGRLWVGTSAGLRTLAPGAAVLERIETRVGKPGGLPHQGVLGLLIDRKDQLWVDTPSGLARLLRSTPDGAEFDPVSARLGILGEPFGANLLEDAQGRIWSQRYLHDPQRDSLYELGRADGADLGTPWFRAYTATRDGLLMFGGSKGLLLIDPSGFKPWTWSPPLAVTELKRDGVSFAPGAFTEALTLAPEHRGFSVEFSALDFSAPQRNRYAYRLAGFEEDWVATDPSRRVASYTSLNPGDYTLQIRGSGRTGIFSANTLELPVKVLAPYWQTIWFQAAVALALLAFGWLLLLWYHGRIRRRAEQLQLMVTERTAELSTAKDSAESALKQLQAAQQELVAREKMVSLGQLVAGVAHEINTPVGVALTASSFLGDRSDGMLGLLNSGKLGRQELTQFITQANEAAGMIRANLQRAAELVRNFKQVSVDRSSDDRRRFNLAYSLNAVIDSLRLTWKRRPIELELACPAELEMDSYPGALGQVITNLIQNALLHAYPEGRGGCMRIAASADAPEQIRLVFEDDGAGIKPAELARIFEPFFTTRRAQGGSGLGLHIVYNLVTVKLGGRVSASGEPGKGMRFEMLLPRVVPG